LIRIGLIGKTNTGKTTFFNSATLLSAEVSTYPFTTKEPNIGQGFVQTLCVCRELGVTDNPRNSTCIDGWRFVPFELIDLPGLIKGSWEGKGLGTQFLGIASQADALLHIADASGSVDADGKITKPGQGNPVVDVYDIEEELVKWFIKIIEKSVKRITKKGMREKDPAEALVKPLAGLRVTLRHIQQALKEADLEEEHISDWRPADLTAFARALRKYSKPTIIIANKMDLGPAEKNYERLAEEFGQALVIPCSSEAELALRRAEQKGYIRYVPGEEQFQVVDASNLTPEQTQALNYVQQRVFTKWIRTGVQFALNTCTFKLLGMNTVYPVEDPTTFADKSGHVLPDAFLIRSGEPVLELARQIHSELARTMIHALDARTGLRLPNDYVLRDRDVVKIVATARKRKSKKTAA
jgi:ribosome-binding ATPase YchF (GTP1/OBG family)